MAKIINRQAGTIKEVIANWYIILNPEDIGKLGDKDIPNAKAIKKANKCLENIKKSNFEFEEFEKLLKGENIDKYTVGEILNINQIFFGKSDRFVPEIKRHRQ